jgi:hypothetical protein
MGRPERPARNADHLTFLHEYAQTFLDTSLNIFVKHPLLLQGEHIIFSRMRQAESAPIYCGITNATLEISKNAISWPPRPIYAASHNKKSKEVEQGGKGHG